MQVNRWFTSGLFGTQTDGSGGPFRAPSPVCTPVLGRKKALALIPTSLILLGSVWFNQSVSAETVAVVSSSAPIIVSADWTPTPQAGLSRPVEKRDHSLTLEQWRALQAFPEDQQVLFACIAFKESGFDKGASIIDIDGLPREGAWMVGETWWGPVPDTLTGQAEQVAGIASEHGSKPWTTRRFCE